MLAAEMKKGIKCFVQGSVDLQDEKACKKCACEVST